MKQLAQATIPSEWGSLKVFAFGDQDDERQPHLAIVSETGLAHDEVLVRIHSECLTGDLLKSRKCDCGEQFNSAMNQISQNGGILIYLRQEGRGIGLTRKLQAYQLQDKGLNTVEANLELGHAPDERSYGTAVQILQELGVRSIRLLTNNPDKIKAIEDSAIDLIERVPLVIPPNRENAQYFETKRTEMGHMFGDL